MATYTRFEDLGIWQKARELCRMVHDIYLNSNLSKDYRLWDQINGSSGSVMDNIAEGFERGGNKEFIQFLSIAKSSAGETKSQTYRMFDRNYINEDVFEKMISFIQDLINQIGGFMNYLKKSEIKGVKYKK